MARLGHMARSVRIPLRHSPARAPERTTGYVTERHHRPWADVRYRPLRSASWVASMACAWRLNRVSCAARADAGAGDVPALGAGLSRFPTHGLSAVAGPRPAWVRRLPT